MERGFRLRTDYIGIIFILLCGLILCNAVSAADPSQLSVANHISTNKIVKTGSTTGGCYIGAYLGGGSSDHSSMTISTFNKLTGKKHAIFSRYVDIKDSKNPNHWVWTSNVVKSGAMPMFIYDPYSGLNSIKTTDVQYFANKCKALKTRVFIVFGHEMNIPYNPWGFQPTLYRAKFRQVAEIFHSTAPNVKMCWVPNQNWGYPWKNVAFTGDGYTEYYPSGVGKHGSYVDWVGLNFYDKDYDENNIVSHDFFKSNIVNGAYGMNFYLKFAVGKNKPMLISEIASFDPNKDPTVTGKRVPLTTSAENAFKQSWISQIYNATFLKTYFPRLKAIIYFNVSKYENIDTKTHNGAYQFKNILVDYRIPSYYNYGKLIKNSYFLGGT